MVAMITLARPYMVAPDTGVGPSRRGGSLELPVSSGSAFMGSVWGITGQIRLDFSLVARPSARARATYAAPLVLVGAASAWWWWG